MERFALYEDYPSLSSRAMWKPCYKGNNASRSRTRFEKIYSDRTNVRVFYLFSNENNFLSIVYFPL